MAKACARFVPDQFLEFLGKDNIQEIRRGDSISRDLTILFSDVRGFTALSENLEAERTFRFLNDYLDIMNPIILEHGGFVDKFIGDAIMALFPETPTSAVRAGLSMLRKLAEYNIQRVREKEIPILLGIGIHTGSLMLGTVGSENRMETTVIGDTVNLTSRLQELTKLYGVPLLVTDAVFPHLCDSGLLVRVLDRVRLRGKSRSTTIYEVFVEGDSVLQNQRKDLIDRFEEGIFLYLNREFSRALEIFDRCLEIMPEDGATILYRKRCQRILRSGVSESWDGVTTLHGREFE